VIEDPTAIAIVIAKGAQLTMRADLETKRLEEVTFRFGGPEAQIAIQIDDLSADELYRFVQQLISVGVVLTMKKEDIARDGTERPR
jgi:hypothetical protein